MWGVEAAVFGLALLVIVVGLWTAPVWMRVLSGFGSRLWTRLGKTEPDVEIIEKEIPREER